MCVCACVCVGMCVYACPCVCVHSRGGRAENKKGGGGERAVEYRARVE